jgi:hypothetical protein
MVHSPPFYEVHNTFGERYSYLVPVDRAAGAVVDHIVTGLLRVAVPGHGHDACVSRRLTARTRHGRDLWGRE